ncbi:exo-alpha-sialidase [Poriferisphaera sp. WC338]|uniref:exo-alpha-sialidase n=1 Tax=Poriferisphaera sp. WC338 TaxID=3425129 RepID=UPI003D81A4D6
MKLIVVGVIHLMVAITVFAQMPVRWEEPKGYHPDVIGLGLPQLQGVVHELLYDPLPMTIGSGEGVGYPSTGHGLYNHHPHLLVADDYLIAYWTNHAIDENGAGQRLLGRLGKIHQDKSIQWLDGVFEIAPPATDVWRRAEKENVLAQEKRFISGEIKQIGGRLYVVARLRMYLGWTDDMNERFRQSNSINTARFSLMDGREKGFPYDIRWDIGPTFYQQLKIEGGEIRYVSEMFVDGAVYERLAVTGDKVMLFNPLQDLYRDVKDVSKCDEQMRRNIRAMSERRDRGRPRFNPGTRHLTVNGKHGLAHLTQYQISDGQWMAVRDNLADPGCLYVSTTDESGAYQLAVKTNLPGYALSFSGRLDDGRVWLITNSKDRRDLVLMLSQDGVVFDQTAVLVSVWKPWTQGVGKSRWGGPQYPHVVQHGNQLYVIYSIGKQQIGFTRVPIESLADGLAR